jgi:hypothetical protein
MTDTKSTATMQLPMDLIAPAIQAHVNTAVIEALKGGEYLITKLVTEIMGQKVNSEGQKSNYGADTPWLTWAVQDIVRGAIRESIKEHLAGNAPKIKRAIEAEMKKANSKLVTALVNGMATGMAEKFADDYRCKIEFSAR